MTLTQAQHLLAYLGYYTMDVDGLYGPGTKSAITEFQKNTEGLKVDGLQGPKTDQALIDAVVNGRFKPNDTLTDCGDDASVYLRPDGYYHIPRGVNVQLSMNLWSREGMCQGVGCCTESIISKRMVETFQQIRDAYGSPIEITSAGGSGYRCPIHNVDPSVGGATNSLHLTGDAFDLHAGDKARLLAVCKQIITNGEIGIYSWGIHAGVWDRGYLNLFYGR